MALKQRTLKSSVVVLGGFGASQFIRFAGSLITTRLLAPELFGVMAIATTIATVVSLLTDVGFTMNVSRSPRGAEKDFLKTVFTVRMILAIAVSIVYCLIALGIFFAQGQGWVPADSPYGHEDLPLILAVLAGTGVLGSFRSIELELRVRMQLFSQEVLLNLLAQLLSISFAILYAYHNPSINALLGANVMASVVLTFGSYIMFGWSYFGFKLDKEAVTEIFHFGKWIMLSTSISVIPRSMDQLAFGFLMNVSQLGVYSIASFIANAAQMLTGKLNQLLFSALSEVIRTSPERISEVYYRIRFYRDLLMCGPGIFLLAFGDVLIWFLYDDRFLEAGHFLRLLSVNMVIQSFLYKDQVITALGNSKIQFHLSCWRFFGTFVLLFLGFQLYGISGMVLGYAIRPIFGSWLLFIEFYRLGHLRLKKELRTFWLVAGLLLLAFSARCLFLEWFDTVPLDFI